MTLAWIEAQIEETINAANSQKNVYDLAMLCICREEFARRAAPVPDYSQAAEPPEERRRREAVTLTAYSADLDSVPTLDQVDEAMGAVVVNSPEERERMNDLKTWRKIIGG